MGDALLLVLSYALLCAGFFWLGWDTRGDAEESRRWKREKEAREREAERRRDAQAVVWIPGVGWREMERPRMMQGLWPKKVGEDTVAMEDAWAAGPEENETETEKEAD